MPRIRRNPPSHEGRIPSHPRHHGLPSGMVNAEAPLLQDLRNTGKSINAFLLKHSWKLEPVQQPIPAQHEVYEAVRDSISEVLAERTETQANAAPWQFRRRGSASPTRRAN